jgi:electron transfer flavoprotein alpha subunit
MTGLRIDTSLCIGCSLCVSACPQAVLVLENDVAVELEGCILCGICVQTCPVEAISIEKEEVIAENRDFSGIWVVTQLRGDGSLLPVSLELVGQGLRLANERGCDLSVLLAGSIDLSVQAQQLLQAGADKVYLCQDQSFATGLEEPYYDWLAAMAKQHKPEVILVGATDWGRSIAPRVAARLRTGLTADCTVLSIDRATKLLHQTRPAFGGNLMATIICPNHRPQMATVRPGIFPLPDPVDNPKGEIVICKPPRQSSSLLQLLQCESANSGRTLADAEILLIAGRGIGNQKNLKLMQRLAEALGADWGVSRPLVDAGWAEYQHQVGQTGSTVAPRVLLSFGVSGAIQHLAGIGRSECIVAINNDSTAPIFSVAQMGIVGDCVEIIKEWLKQIEGESVERL